MVDNAIRNNFDIDALTKSITDFHDKSKRDDVQKYLSRLLLIATYYRFVKNEKYADIITRKQVLNSKIIEEIKKFTSDDVGIYVLLLLHVDHLTVLTTFPDNKQLYSRLLSSYENIRSKNDTKSLIIRDVTRAVHTVFGNMVLENSKLVEDVVSFLIDDESIEAVQDMINLIVHSGENTGDRVEIHNEKIHEMNDKFGYIKGVRTSFDSRSKKQ